MGHGQSISTPISRKFQRFSRQIMDGAWAKHLHPHFLHNPTGFRGKCFAPTMRPPIPGQKPEISAPAAIPLPQSLRCAPVTDTTAVRPDRAMAGNQSPLAQAVNDLTEHQSRPIDIRRRGTAAQG